jgi:hypothetical protein
MKITWELITTSKKRCTHDRRSSRERIVKVAERERGRGRESEWEKERKAREKRRERESVCIHTLPTTSIMLSVCITNEWVVESKKQHHKRKRKKFPFHSSQGRGERKRIYVYNISWSTRELSNDTNSVFRWCGYNIEAHNLLKNSYSRKLVTDESQVRKIVCLVEENGQRSER